MFIKKFDLLSPSITLYFKGEAQHRSIFSGILSICSYLLVLSAVIYYFLGYIQRKAPKVYFFTRYVEDAGYFPVNATQMFNFIQISSKRDNKPIPFDQTVFRAVGVDDVFYDEYYQNPEILENIDHWIYGYCNNDSDTEGIGYLINFDYYEQSACIRTFYDHQKKQYFKTGEAGFRWPVIEKGCSNPERTYYGIILQRCDESPDILKSQGPECKTSEEITEEINLVGLKYQIIDHYADVLNYDMPLTKYFYEITSAITNGLFIVNHLNFNPAIMLTHNGIFFDNQVEEHSYVFTQNEKHTLDQSNIPEGMSNNGCLIGIYFWMQNTLQYYERNYDRLQDVLSSIGGISRLILTIASVINLLVNYFIILLDTEELVLNRDEDNLKSKNCYRRSTVFKEANQIMFPPRRVYSNKNNQQKTNYQNLMKDGIYIYPKGINNIRDKNEEKYQNIYNIRNIALNNNNNYYYENNKDENYQKIKEQNSLANKNKYIRRRKLKKGNNDLTGRAIRSTSIRNLNEDIPNNYIISKNEKGDNVDYENRPIKKQNFNWFQYIRYLVCCQKNSPQISYYEDLRLKLISEENIIQSYLDIYLLLKANDLSKKLYTK